MIILLLLDKLAKKILVKKCVTNWTRQIFYTFSYLDGMLLGNLTKRGYILVPWDTHLIMYIHLLRMHKQDRNGYGYKTQFTDFKGKHI